MARIKSKPKTLDLVLIILAIYVFLFVTAMIVLFCIFQAVPDTLIQYGMGGAIGELFATAWIETRKQKNEKKDDTHD